MRFHLIFNSWSLWSRVCISYSTNYNAECHFYSQKQHHHHLWCQTTVKTAYNSSLIFIEFNRNSSTLKWRSPLWLVFITIQFSNKLVIIWNKNWMFFKLLFNYFCYKVQKTLNEHWAEYIVSQVFFHFSLWKFRIASSSSP